MSDEGELLKGIAARDPEAFRTLMDRYAGPVINLSYRFLGTQHDAEDVAQDVFLRLYRNPPVLAPGTKLFTWLYRVAVNRCYDLLRKKARGGVSISLDAPAAVLEEEGAPLSERLETPSSRNPREQAVESELASVVQRAVAALPFPLRAPLLLSVFEGFSHAEISCILGISAKAVERRLSRAREMLKVRLSFYR